MSDEGFNLSIGGDVHGDVAKTIDKSQHQITNIAGDMHGDVNNAMAGHDYNAKAKEAVGKLLGELAECDEMDEFIVAKDYAEADVSEFHPISLMSTINEMADRDEPPTQEEATSLGDRFKTMLSRVGTAGKQALVNIGPIAVAGMRATASITPPWNIVCPIVEAAVNQFSHHSSDSEW